MWAVRAVLVTILLIMVVAFAYNNMNTGQLVDVNLKPFYYNYADVPLVTVVFWSFVAGIILAMILFITTYIKLSMQIHGTKKKIKALEQEVSVLRNRPIEESADLLKGTDSNAGHNKSAFEEN